MGYEQERIKPYNEGEKGQQVEQMFDNIAPTYDQLNHRLSWNIDRGWRRKAIQAHYDRMGIHATCELAEDIGSYRTKYEIQGEPLVQATLPSLQHRCSSPSNCWAQTSARA